MIRNFSHLNMYLNELVKDIYPQPPDDGHTGMARSVFDKWISQMSGLKTVLDAGCGDTAMMMPWFEAMGVQYTGLGFFGNENVINRDFTFTEFDDESFDMVVARHALEHSPMPLITLMEWHRVAKHFLCLVNPRPDVWGWAGQNHYSVMNDEQLRFILKRAGWHIIWEDNTNPAEYRFMCEKVDRREWKS